MHDSRGKRIESGDRVQLWPGSVGEVVCSFDDQQYGQDFVRGEWEHLESGALFRLPDGTVLHYDRSDEDVVIVEKRRG